jgi:glucose-6-phosphate-specific signal transduction histidine kinase
MVEGALWGVIVMLAGEILPGDAETRLTDFTHLVAHDGIGGAALGRSSGLIGLVDRVEALGGRFALEGPAGRGTTISIELPLESPAMEERPL